MTDEGKVFLKWWEALQPQDVAHPRNIDPAFTGMGRGDRAQLRRCQRPDQVVFYSAFQRLLQPLAGRADPLDLALVAGVVAHVKEHTPSRLPSMAAQLGQHREGSDQPLMSERRFRALIACNDPDDFFRQMKRALDLLDGVTNVTKLARDCLRWCQEHDSQTILPKERLQIDWATHYYQSLLHISTPTEEPT